MNNDHNEITKYKTKIIETVLKFIPNTKIYLYGSRAKGIHHKTSDIDLALDTKEKIDRDIITQVKSALDALNIPYTIDIVDFTSISDDLKNQIKRDKILWN